MVALLFDPDCSPTERRSLLYGGDILVYSPSKASLRFVEYTRELCKEAFGDMDPLMAQHAMDVGEYAALLGQLKPLFINHAESAACVASLLLELGCEPEETYFDVPRLRTSTSGGYLTTGIAFAWHPHRDTWYSAPSSQVNWWVPIWPITRENTMCFYPAYFDRAVANDSAAYNYYEHNAKHRGAHVASMVKRDSRAMPGPTTPIDKSSELRVVAPVGSVLVFSGAQLHASVPNTSGVTRISVDFRTVHRADAATGRGAPMVDVACGGSTIRDYRALVDRAQLPDEIIARYHDAEVDGGALVYSG